MLLALALLSQPALAEDPVPAPDAPKTLNEAARRYRDAGLVPPSPGGPWQRVQLSRTAGIVAVSGGPALVLVGWLAGNVAAISDDDVTGTWALTGLAMGGGLEIMANGVTRLVFTKGWRNSLRAEAWGVDGYRDPEEAARRFHTGMAISNLGSGAVVTLLGVGVLGVSAQVEDDFPGHRDADYARATGGVLVAEGVLCMGTSIVHFVQRGSPTPSGVALAPLWKGDAAGMSMGGTF